MFTKKIFLLLVILFAYNFSESQNISGVINAYQKVVHYSFCHNSVTVQNSSSFIVGDKVLLIQMRGAAIDTSNTITSGSINSYNNAGNYEFGFIQSIVGNEIFLKDSVIRHYDDSASIQIVRVPRYINATVTDTLKCLPWDGNSGGILVFDVSGTLTINALIDASDKGFRGGEKFYNAGVCSLLPADYVRGSLLIRVKGEGISSLPANLMGGRGTVANGGGASGGQEVQAGLTDAWYLGGGGGGNFGNGGSGGKSSTFCAAQYIQLGGLGGRSLSYSSVSNKIFMAGGGGVGHHRNDLTGPEFGTSGGGVVIIKANTIVCNNQTIEAQAFDVPYNYNNVGRSGGGAGGTVILEVQNYSGNLNINVKGGKGGSNSGGNNVGPGGGGSGGIVWVNQSSFPSNLIVTSDGGLNGMQTSHSLAWGATPGDAGGTLTGLSLLQSSNHVFVPVSQTTTITTNSPLCEGDTLNLSTGSVPPSVGYSWTGPNGFISNIQNPTLNNVLIAEAGLYNLEIIVQGCPGPITHSNVWIGMHPSPPLTASDTVCNGNPNPSLVAIGNHITWYADSTLNNFLASGSIYIPTTNIVGIHTFYIVQSDSVCKSLPTEAFLDILPSPPQPVINNQTVCFGNPVSPFVATGNGIVYWYSDSLLQHLIFTGHTFISSVTLPGIYNYYATLYDTTYSCTSAKKIITLTIIPHAYAIASNDTSICKNGVANLNVNAPLNSTFLWSNGGVSQQISVTPITQTKYYVTVDNGCGTAKDSVTVSISPLPPVSTNDTVCYGFPNPGLIALGTSIKWYSDSTLNNLISSGSTYFPTITAVGNHVYWATQTNSICESYPQKVSLEILPSPTPPVINNVTVCFGNPNNPFNAVGNGIISWYSDSLLTNLIHTGNTFTSTQTNSGIYHYYATTFDTVYSCSSQKKIVTLAIVPPVFAAASNDTTICKDGVANLFVNATFNSTFLWSNGHTTQQISVTPTHETTFYVTVDNGCGTATDSVKVSINPLPPSTTNDTVCFGIQNPGLVAIGNNIKWYSDSTLINFLFSGSIYIPVANSVGTHIFWATQSDSLCESYPHKVTLEILPIPAPPVINNLITCFGNSNNPFSASGNGIINWYSDSLLNNLIHTGNTYLSTETNLGIYHYYATVLAINTCTSLKKDVTLLILPHAYAIASNDTTVCYGETVPLFVAASMNSTFLWSNGDTTQQIIINPIIQTQLYVTVDNGCGTAKDSITVFVNPLPNAYAGVDTSICIGQSAILTATGGIAYLWSNGAGNTSTVIVTPNTPTNYIVSVTDANGCKNTDDIFVNLNSLPTALITGDSLICEGNPDILTATGGIHFLWSIGDTTANISVTPSNNAIYYVTVTNSNNCKDSSNFEVIVHNAFNINLTSNFTPDNSITQGQIITFTASPNIYSLFNFYINDLLKQSTASNIFSSASIANSDIVSVIAYEIGCPSLEDSLLIKVKELPNAFTPFEKDGINEVFAKGLDLTIINRWGQELYKGIEGWNGEYKNEKVSPGTYYYTVELNKGTSYSKILTGSVNVVVK